MYDQPPLTIPLANQHLALVDPARASCFAAADRFEGKFDAASLAVDFQRTVIAAFWPDVWVGQLLSGLIELGEVRDEFRRAAQTLLDRFFRAA